MDFAALVDARHSWNDTRRFAHAPCLGLLSHVQSPPRGGVGGKPVVTLPNISVYWQRKSTLIGKFSR